MKTKSGVHPITLSIYTHMEHILVLILAGFAALLFALWLTRQRDGRKRAGAVLLWLMGAVYLSAVIYLTYFLREAGASDTRLVLQPLWSYRQALRWEDGALRVVRRSLWRQVLLNIMLYIPFGYLGPALLRKRRHPYLWTLAAAAAFSLLTEAVQYLSAHGLSELDDVINNTLGCLMGMLMLWMAERFAAVIRRSRPAN